ncbi:MAG: CPBP family intramembrane metalloprotease [Bacteroidales bacterium]|nr:CPBP family intramembrane metalloprotease [Bacteroidales bacterium]
MLLNSSITGEINKEINKLSLLHKTIIAGVMEEILFRGFLFGLLFRRIKWGFLPASVPGALLFASVHLYQGLNLSEATGIFIVTFLGALWFAWLFAEWNENLRIPIFLHILMNLSWVLFNISDDALGNLMPNIFRIFSIALTVIFTTWNCRKRGYFSISGKNLLINNQFDMI